MKKQNRANILLFLLLTLFLRTSSYAAQKKCGKPKLLGKWIQVGAKPPTTWTFKKNGKVIIKGLATMSVPWSLKKNRLKIHIGSNPVYTIKIKANKMVWKWQAAPIIFIRKK